MAKTKRFKQTDIGPIPEDWEVKTFAACFDVGSSKRVFQSQWTTSGIPFYRARDIVGFNNGEGAVGGLYISPQHYESLKEQYGVPKIGDILVTAVGTLGIVYLVEDNHQFYFKDGNIIWLKRIGDVDSKYLCCLFRSGRLDSQICDTSGGSTVGTYTITNAKKTLFAFPPLPEQRRIAGALGDVDSLLATYDALIEKKRKIKVGAMQELLEIRNDELGMRNVPRRRLPGFTGAWVEKGFDECFSLLSNNTYAREFMCADETGVANIHYGDVLIRYGSVLDFSTTHVDSLQLSVLIKSESLKDGDLIFADTAEDEMVGKAVEVRNLKDRRAVSGLHTVACRSKFEFAEGWLGYYINSPDYHNQLLPLITGTKVSSVSKAGFRQTVLHFPPTLAEQRAIAGVLSDMDAEIAELEREREKTRRIREGMMQELLTGRVRLEVA